MSMARSTPAQKPRGAQSRMSRGGFGHAWGDCSARGSLLLSGGESILCGWSGSRFRIAHNSTAFCPALTPRGGRPWTPQDLHSELDVRPHPIYETPHGMTAASQVELPAPDPDLLRGAVIAVPLFRRLGPERPCSAIWSRARHRPVGLGLFTRRPRRSATRGRTRRRAAALRHRARAEASASLVDAAATSSGWAWRSSRSAAPLPRRARRSLGLSAERGLRRRASALALSATAIALQMLGRARRLQTPLRAAHLRDPAVPGSGDRAAAGAVPLLAPARRSGPAARSRR